MSVQAVLDSAVQMRIVPGAVALVATGDTSEVFSAGDIARGSICRIASLTKPITALATLLLVNDGKLGLDEPVDRLLPELANRRVLRRPDGPLDDTVPAQRAITVADLLTFRCGWGLAMTLCPLTRAVIKLGLMGFGPPDPSSPLDPDTWLERLGTLPLMAQPGESWLYTTSSNILGVLVARAAGMSFPDFLQRRVFAPLGMRDTAFYVPTDKLHRLPVLYKPDGVTVADVAATSRWGAPPALPAGDSGLVSTIDDYFAFTRCLARGGAPLIPPSFIADMTRDHLTAEQRAGGVAILQPNRGWGYGLSVAAAATADGWAPGTYGWSGGTGATWFTDPNRDLTAIVFSQVWFASPSFPPLHLNVWNAVL